MTAYAEPGAVTVFDGEPWTAADAGETLELQLGSKQTINRIHFSESSAEVANGKIQKFHIEVKDGDVWKNVYDNDYILKDRDCILPEDVTTDAVRLVIDAKDSGSVTISEFTADYQDASGSSEFMNVGYISNQWYDIGNKDNRPIPQQLESLTDIIMIGSFVFDQDGGFYVIKQIPGPETTGVYKPDSEEAGKLMDDWLEKLGSYSKNVAEGNTNIWISFQGLKAGTGSDPKKDPIKNPDLHGYGTGNSAYSSAFKDEAVSRSFAESVAKFAREHGIYGVDLDWEYPNEAPEAKKGDCMTAFHTLVRVLGEVLHENGLKFSCTLAPGYKDNLQSDDYKSIDYLSWMLYTNTRNNNDYGKNVKAQIPYTKMADLVQDAIDNGCAASKIWVGLPLFGNLQGGKNGAQQYFNLYVTYLAENGVETVPKGLNTINFKGEDSYYNGIYLLQDKVAYAVDKGCAGVMTWWVAQDIHVFDDGEEMEYTVNGKTATMHGEDSLSRAVYEAIKRFTGVDPIPEKEPVDEAELLADVAAIPDMTGNANPIDRKVFEDKVALVLEGMEELEQQGDTVSEELVNALEAKLAAAFGITTEADGGITYVSGAVLAAGLTTYKAAEGVKKVKVSAYDVATPSDAEAETAKEKMTFKLKLELEKSGSAKEVKQTEYPLTLTIDYDVDNADDNDAVWLGSKQFDTEMTGSTLTFTIPKGTTISGEFSVKLKKRSSGGSGGGTYHPSTTVSNSASGSWIQDETGWWFSYTSGGYPAAKWERIKGQWYYFNENGYMATGWQLIGGEWYHLSDSGERNTGWYLDPLDGRWYYFDSQGVMKTGWQLVDGKYYYLNDVQAAPTYVYQADIGSWVYATAGARPYGSMYAGEMTPDQCLVDADGAWIQ